MIRIWFNSNGLYVLSEEVAENFNISHDDLIKDIMHLKAELNLPKEWIDELADENGYFISRNAFVLLVSELKSYELVIEYLNAFDGKERMLDVQKESKSFNVSLFISVFALIISLITLIMRLTDKF